MPRDDYVLEFYDFWLPLLGSSFGEDPVQSDANDQERQALRQISLDLVARELYDYKRMMQEVGVAYEALTCGRVTKPNTLAQHVIDIAQECQAEAQDQSITEILSELDACETMDDVRAAIQGFRLTAAL
jgi:hypothetical protein